MHVEIAVHPELRDEALHHAEETTLVEIAPAYQFVEAVYAARRPRAVRFYYEIALRSLKLHVEDFRDDNFRRRLLAGGRKQSERRENRYSGRTVDHMPA